MISAPPADLRTFFDRLHRVFPVDDCSVAEGCSAVRA